MKVLFVYPNLTGQESPSFGLASLSACIKEKGHESFLMDYTWNKGFDVCIKKVREIQPHLIAFTLVSGEFHFCLDLAKEIKKRFDIPIIFGGVQPTIAPNDVIKHEQVDIVCIGEGEEALVELLGCMERGSDFSNIKNLWVKNKNKVIRNSLRPLIDVNKLPVIDRELYDFKRYLKINNGAIHVAVGRGCPFSCSYCINHILHKMFKGKPMRLRSQRSVIDEIKSLKKKYEFNYIHYYDDVLTTNKKWLKKFCELYAEEVNLPFCCKTRPESMDDEICSYLKKANCKIIRIGLECGNEKIRNDIMNRRMTNEQIITAFKLSKKWGFKTYCYNIIGIPFETDEVYWETINLNRIVKPDYLQVCVFQPFPSTQIHELCLKKGFIKKNWDTPIGWFNYTIDQPYVSEKEMRRRLRYFRFRVIRTYNFKKSLIVLFYDLFFPYYYRFRSEIPLGVKKMIAKIQDYVQRF